MDTHMRMEEAKVLPIVASRCSEAEQCLLIWNTVRAMPLRLLERMLPWVASQVRLLTGRGERRLWSLRSIFPCLTVRSSR